MHDYQQIGSRNDLYEALVSGDLKASGRNASAPEEFREVPKIEWSGLTLDPPTAYYQDPTQGKVKPWKDIRVESSAVKKR